MPFSTRRTRTTQIEVGGIVADVTFKNIRSLRLSVHPPDGDVRISAPRWTSVSTIRDFATGRLDWIREKQQQQREKERDPALHFVEGEEHLLWGVPHRLKILEGHTPQSVALAGGEMVLNVRPGSDENKRQAVIEAFYRDTLKAALPELISRWEPVMDVTVNGFHVRKMTSRWGSCNVNAGTIRLNTQLVRKEPHCLEYVVVHEMAHLLEASHNKRFHALMDRFLPDWKAARADLNRVLPRK